MTIEQKFRECNIIFPKDVSDENIRLLFNLGSWPLFVRQHTGGKVVINNTMTDWYIATEIRRFPLDKGSLLYRRFIKEIRYIKNSYIGYLGATHTPFPFSKPLYAMPTSTFKNLLLLAGNHDFSKDLKYDDK